MDQESLNSAMARANFTHAGGVPGNWAQVVAKASEFDPARSIAIVEVSVMGLHRRPEGGPPGAMYPTYLFMFPFHFAIVTESGMFRKRLETVGEDYPNYSSVVPNELDFANDDKTGEYAIQFYRAGTVPVARLSWPWFRKGFGSSSEARLQAATERNRILDHFYGLGAPR